MFVTDENTAVYVALWFMIDTTSGELGLIVAFVDWSIDRGSAVIKEGMDLGSGRLAHFV